MVQNMLQDSLKSLNLASNDFPKDDASYISRASTSLESEEKSFDNLSLKKETIDDSTGKIDVVVKSHSIYLKLFACILYAVSSSGLTFVNKSIYVKFGFKSPLDVCYNLLTLIAFACAMLMQRNDMHIDDDLQAVST